MELKILTLNAIGALTPVLALIAFLVPLVSKFARNSKAAPFLMALAGSLYAAFSSTLAFYYLIAVESKPLVYLYGGWPPHFGIVYEIDAFNAVIGLLTSFIMVSIVLYSHWYNHHLDDPSWYYTMLVGLEAGLLGCIYTGDAFNLFVMIEVLSISAYGLVAYHRDKSEAVEAAAKYALIGAVATVFYFIGVILLYAGFGTVNMALLSELSRAKTALDLRYVSLLALSLSLWVFTYKSALVPNHFWLPDAHPEAPTPISAALSGLVVNVGVYASARFLYTLFTSNSIASGYRETVLAALFALGAVSGVVGALMMMAQKDIKRLLAYSTISHMGIAYMGISAGFLVGGPESVKLAITGAVVHIVAHSIAKATLFMISGVFIDASNSRDLDLMRGVGRQYPLTAASLIICFLSLAGFVPFLGFYSKLLIALGYANAGFVLGPALIIVISALSLLGYMKVISSTIFSIGGPYRNIEGRWVEIMLFAMATSLLVLGVFMWYLTPFFEKASISLVVGVGDYVEAALREIPPELRRWLP